MSRNMIIQKFNEVRDGRNQTVGVFVGKLYRSKIVAGWSRCKAGSTDVFNMEEGIKIAIKNGIEMNEIPVRSSLRKFSMEFDIFCDRCLRYFQGFDFYGKTDVIYSKRAMNKINQEKNINIDHKNPVSCGCGCNEKEDLKDLKEVGIEIDFIRNQLLGIGVNKADVDNFLKYGMPVVNQLKEKGIYGVALPTGDMTNVITAMNSFAKMFV